MRILAIDTSSKNLSLAAAEDEKILKYRNIRTAKVLSSSIIPEIRQMFKDVKWGIDDVNAIAVGLGPGAFTSLRVGISTVKGLAFRRKIKIAGQPSLDTIALGLQQEGTVAVICDAKRSLVYGCVYERKGGRIKKRTDYQLAPIGDLLRKLKGKVVFTGDAIPLCKDEIKKKKGIQPVFAPEKDWQPQARFLVPLTFEKLKKNKGDNIETLVPLYLYPEDCQVRKPSK